jgi:predicted nucleic acid-binding protein
MKRIFADTFYFLAVLNRRDPAHEKAVEFYGNASLDFVTTEWILTEVADATATSEMRAGFQRLFELLEKDPHMRIVEASHESFGRGLALYFDRPDKNWSLTDCLSFTVMQEENLAEALTGDHHFEQAGFSALLRNGGG